MALLQTYGVVQFLGYIISIPVSVLFRQELLMTEWFKDQSCCHTKKPPNPYEAVYAAAQPYSGKELG
jgi:hypothetical protein